MIYKKLSLSVLLLVQVLKRELQKTPKDNAPAVGRRKKDRKSVV